MNTRENCQKLLHRARRHGYHVSMITADGEIIGKPTTDASAIDDILAVDEAIITFTNCQTSFYVLAVNENTDEECWANYTVSEDSASIVENLS